MFVILLYLLRYTELCDMILCYVITCYVMLCYIMLCYVMLCYVMLCYVMLCDVMLCDVMSCDVMSHQITFGQTIQCYIISYHLLQPIVPLPPSGPLRPIPKKSMSRHPLSSCRALYWYRYRYQAVNWLYPFL